jgi:hypothetical protein
MFFPSRQPIPSLVQSQLPLTHARSIMGKLFVRPRSLGLRKAPAKCRSGYPSTEGQRPISRPQVPEGHTINQLRGFSRHLPIRILFGSTTTLPDLAARCWVQLTFSQTLHQRARRKLVSVPETRKPTPRRRLRQFCVLKAQGLPASLGGLKCHPSNNCTASSALESKMPSSRRRSAAQRPNHDPQRMEIPCSVSYFVNLPDYFMREL